MRWCLFLLLLLTGCSQIIVEKNIEQNTVVVKVNTFFKDVDFDRAEYKDLFLLERYVGESNKMRVISPWGAVDTKEIEDKRL